MPRPGAVFLILAATMLLAQTEFEVASVKPNPSGAPRISIQPSPNGITIQNTPLRIILSHVYKARLDQILGGPAWMDQIRWDISARSEHRLDDVRRNEMLEALLRERFQLAIRREERDGTILALVPARGGHKLRAPSETEHAEIWVRATGDGLLRLHATRVPLSRIAATLEQTLAQTVRDESGLAGDFSFDVDFTREAGLIVNAPPPVPLRDGTPMPASDGASIFTALSRVGLRLEPRRGRIAVFVVERAEKAQQNQ